MNLANDQLSAISRGWELVLACPVDGRPLTRTMDRYVCASGLHCYHILDDIPLLFEPNEGRTADVTNVVKAFYENTPFPNYDELDSRDSLVQRAKRGQFAKLLNDQIPEGAIVLDAGCGTGQLGNFLGMHWNRTVIAADVCLNSLRIARAFRDQFSIRNTHFLQMNLFRPPFRDIAFDLVICNGVLHHTSDPEAGLRSLLRKVKPGGHIIIGLYNATGRLPTDWRRWAIRLLGDRMARLDARLRQRNLNGSRWQAGFRDQYQHPHESKHTYGEVLRWFDAADLEYISSIPQIDGVPLNDDGELFVARSRGSPLDRGWIQLEMLLRGGVDGGLFIMIGKPRNA